LFQRFANCVSSREMRARNRMAETPLSGKVVVSVSRIRLVARLFHQVHRSSEIDSFGSVGPVFCESLIQSILSNKALLEAGFLVFAVRIDFHWHIKVHRLSAEREWASHQVHVSCEIHSLEISRLFKHFICLLVILFFSANIFVVAAVQIHRHFDVCLWSIRSHFRLFLDSAHVHCKTNGSRCGSIARYGVHRHVRFRLLDLSEISGPSLGVGCVVVSLAVKSPRNKCTAAHFQFKINAPVLGPAINCLLFFFFFFFFFIIFSFFFFFFFFFSTNYLLFNFH
jgi:hypothetical protein